VSQDGPSDTRHLIGHSHNGFVPATFFTNSIDPSAQRVIFPDRLDDHCSGAMDQLATQITVASFADAKQDILAATAVLAWNQSQRRRGIPTMGIGAAITDGAPKSTGYDRAKPWNGLQTPASIVLLAQQLQFVRVECNMFIKFDKLLITPRQQVSEFRKRSLKPFSASSRSSGIPLRKVASPVGKTMPYSPSNPRVELLRAVRSLTHLARIR